MCGFYRLFPTNCFCSFLFSTYDAYYDNFLLLKYELPLNTNFSYLISDWLFSTISALSTLLGMKEYAKTCAFTLSFTSTFYGFIILRDTLWFSFYFVTAAWPNDKKLLELLMN
jgi:hypothetical protein